MQKQPLRSAKPIYQKQSAAVREAIIVSVRPRFGFARIEGGQRDIFVPGSRLLGSLPGDRVLLRIRSRDGESDEGEVQKILEQSDPLLSGTVREDEREGAWLVFDNSAYSPVAVDRANSVPVSAGDKVTARILRDGSNHRDYRAAVVQSFGSGDTARNCCRAILEASGVRQVFSEELLASARKIAERPISEQELRGRLDLRGEPVFTIDGVDTKDIDDAVSLEVTENGWLLGVHIADVSHYLRLRSPLDREAMARGTSIYFADSVIPMLPPALSNGICSLNPNEDRLTISALLEIAPDGTLKNWKFRKSIIRSRIKGVYSEINQIFAQTAGEEILQRYTGLADTLFEMRKLACLLRARRFARGSLELSSVESKITLDGEGRAVSVAPRFQGESERIIEEFMLTANEAAARFALSRELPFVYRIHEPPAVAKLEALSELLKAVGMPSASVRPGVAPAVLSRILKRANKTRYGEVVNAAMLRTMQKARYEEKNLGHYGLALEHYAHFTSPIRRYPDLAIHRIITALLGKASPSELSRRYGDFVRDAARLSSMAELRAMEVERACEDSYKAEYLRGFLGERFSGTITSAAPHGIYVMLDNTAEGLVRTEHLGENVLYDGRMQYTDFVTGRHFRVGDRVEIVVAAADVSTGKVDFLLAKGSDK